MIHIGQAGGFPGDWAYQGDAKLLVQDTVKSIQISLRLTFLEETDIDVTIIWGDILEDERLKISAKIQETKYQVLVVRNNILLIGYSYSPLNIGTNQTTNFIVVRIITYSGLPKNIEPTMGNAGNFVRLRAYLNDEFSSFDGVFNKEFQNTAEIFEKGIQESIKKPNIYCALNSGYKVKCGKKYSAHNDNNIFGRRNIDTLYKLSFIDVINTLENHQKAKGLCVDSFDDHANEISSIQHLEDTLNKLCAFLSIVCDYEVLPVYYDYSVYSQDKYIYGRIIPIWKRRRVARISRSWPTQGIHFMGNITSFLECCPIDKRLGRGIEHLKLTVYESTVELRLLAACSAVEYFYSYWFWQMDGCEKLMNGISQENSLIGLGASYINKLKKILGSADGKTPHLSRVIRFFLRDLKVDWLTYMSEEGSPEFLQVRNELLHGSFISDDILIFRSEETAKRLGTEILFSIMKVISKSNDLSLYEDLPIRKPQKDFYTLSDGWSEVKTVLDELHSKKDVKKFWN